MILIKPRIVEMDTIDREATLRKIIYSIIPEIIIK